MRGLRSAGHSGAKSINRPGPSGNTNNWNLEIGPKTRGFGGFFREEEGGELDSSGAEVCEGESRIREACRIAAYRWVQGTQPPAFHLSGLGDFMEECVRGCAWFMLEHTQNRWSKDQAV